VFINSINTSVGSRLKKRRRNELFGSENYAILDAKSNDGATQLITIRNTDTVTRMHGQIESASREGLLQAV
jgi:hypothetical protein